ncbi:hypothetical protein GCM10022246_08020 [Pedobacter ginsengiterrae]|uniref:Response regulatory domain-containing protein n=1 Tax=Pedobacter ginsengiterrae TaxID=871696 RepID=A0ABP7NY16_9SPHI
MARILVVENDLGNAEVIELILLEESYEVITIQQSNLLEAIIEGFSPELIIMDILLDNADGRILSNILKMQHKTCHIPILLITAMMESQALLVNCEADDLMLKPFDYMVLMRKIKTMLN